MNKITKDQLQDYIQEVGDMETEHHKGSSFYASCTHTITQTDIEELKTYGFDASDFLDICVTLNGTWSDDWGCEWYSMDFCKVEEYQGLVPEVIVPEHFVTKQRTEVFVPNW